MVAFWSAPPMRPIHLLPGVFLFLTIAPAACVEPNLPLLPEGGGGGAQTSSGGCGGAECDGTCTNLDDDPLNCGACGHDCFGGACDAGRCQPVLLVGGEIGVHAIAVDEAHIYWGYESDAHLIRRARVDGTEVETLSTTEHAQPFMMVVDGTHLYWTRRQGDHTVMRMPKTGGAEQILAAGSYPTGIAVDGEFVYWANYWSCQTCTTGDVRKVPLAGGTTTVLSDNEPFAAYIATGGGMVIWSDEHVEQHSGKIRAWSASGTETLAFKQGRPHFVTADGSYAFWTAPTDGTVMRALLTGEGTPEALATGEVGPGGIMRDGDRLYWLADESLRSMAITGGPVTTVHAPVKPANIVQDSTSFYWCESESGLIWRLAKPL